MTKKEPISASLPMLSVFCDGLNYSSIKHMPFLSSLNHKPLRTMLGYSISCHATMYTGTYPDEHKICFKWIFDPKKSPYGFVSNIPEAPLLRSPNFKAFISKALSFLLKNTSFMDYDYIVHNSFRNWKYFDTNEKKYWDEENYAGNDIDTIFEIVRRNKLSYKFSGLHRPNCGLLSSLKVQEPSDWVYYFIGETDDVSHKFGPESKETISFLKKVDDFIEKRYIEFSEKYDDFSFLFWSDHGHLPIKKRINIYKTFEQNNMNINHFIHIIDSTTARFLCSNIEEAKIIHSLMSGVKGINFISKNKLKSMNLPIESKYFGHLFYVVDGGYTFSPTIHGYNKSAISMHGYLPDIPNYDGIVVSNISLRNGDLNLIDVFSTLLSSMGISHNSKDSIDMCVRN